MTPHARLHGPRLHLPHLPGLRLEHLLFLALVAGLALFVLEQALRVRRGPDTPPTPAAVASAGPAALRGVPAPGV